MADLFHFKQFSIDQSGCAMKINTDGVLLGALAEVNKPQAILDIGTGTGVIALMLTQRFPEAKIDAVEIDETAAKTAASNFAKSQFVNRLTLFPSSFEQFFEANDDKHYNLIVSNPPFYINSLHSPGAGKKLAKHADVDFFKNLISDAAKHLTAEGMFWLILPVDTAELVKQLSIVNGLMIHHIINIRSYPESKPHRQIISFDRQQTNMFETQFVIYDALKQYSGQYQTALKDFFTIF
ncbi:tRNA1(Val) (adenine(37)-N6)-methyltransferase [Mucilaginibacter boryungensis]|uniref:tRNA1(Val) (adenine(37)-N6)-methyltransferase n=1 Tax=Mucilaginibacter boryungensis TaxID=768480 RepID=A0ABR9XG10_9SPHI|nr:methyltransferase [Mucilaginibacter boryungensis]MBE9666329.1 methyltransferase [Mucilaginibacter boryungensis]